MTEWIQLFGAIACREALRICQKKRRWLVEDTSRLREMIERLRMDHSGASLQVTISARRAWSGGEIQFRTSIHKEGRRDICIDNAITAAAIKFDKYHPRYVRAMLDRAVEMIIPHVPDLMI